jgi:hypothetical protein
MPSTIRRLAADLLLIAAFLLALPFAALAQDKPFAHQGAEREARRYETFLKASVKKERTHAEWRTAGDKAFGVAKDYRAAARSYSAAVVLVEQDWASWLALSKSLLAIPVDKSSSERFDVPVNATAAAYIAYERAPNKTAKAQALAGLGEAFRRRSLWRPAIEAYRQSAALEENAVVRTAYESLRAEHGFRMLDYKIESDAQSPRLCLQFSESLAKGPVDFGKFLQLDGKDVASLAAEDRQLCLDGLVHGKRYEVVVRAGLPSAVAGETLLKTSELGVYVRDRAPSVRVAGNAYVLPGRGQAGIPIVTVNTEKVAVQVYRIGDRGLAGAVLSGDFRKQVGSHLLSEIKESKGERVWHGEMPVKNALNDEVTTAFPVGEAIQRMRPGVYLLTVQPGAAKAADDDDEEQVAKGKRASQWFIVSDLGLTAFSGEDGVHAFVRSLNSAEAQAGVDVRLVARSNEVLASAKTDPRGYVRFEAGLAKGEGGLAPALLVAERIAPASDYTFLDLTGSAFDLTDRGVAGREPARAIEAHVFTERGVYKPGESVHLTAIVREQALRAPKPAPMTLILTRPDGVEQRRQQLDDQGFGGRTISLALSRTAMTGTWRARLHADPKAAPVGEASFLVEDYVPERMDLALEPQDKILQPETPSAIAVKGRYLYGPPAADLAMEAEVVLRPRAADLDGYKGYRFGQADEQVSIQRRQLDALPRTDAKGEAKLIVELPAVPRTARPLEAQIITRLREAGGRSIERSVVLPVDMRQARIGIRPLFDVKALGQGEKANFEVIVLGGDGKPMAANSLRWDLQRIESRWQWYSRDGSWSYEPVKHARRAADGRLDVKAEAPARLALDADWGRYKLEVSSEDGAVALASVGFNAGWWGAESIDTPETLEVALDKTGYKVGDTAKVTIAAPGAGKALIAVFARGLVETREVEVTGKSATVELKVDKSWSPGAYVTATLYRPMDEKLKRMPSRSIGLRWLELDKAPRSVQVGLELPAKVASGAKLTVPVKLGGLAPREEARLVVAAVDVGILNLTRFEAPSPEKFFYSQRRLGTEIRDLYGRLIDGMRADKGRIRTGGDGPGGMAMEGSPPVESPLALFSGLVTPGPDGTALVSFDLPAFNGTVRVMAVAWSRDKVGSAKGDVVVRDPVALLVTSPRFMTLGDQARLELDVHNVEGTAASYKVHVARVPGPGLKGEAVAVHEGTLELEAGERRRQSVMLKGDGLGRSYYEVRVKGPAGIDVARQLALDVKPPGGDIRRVTISSLKPKGGSITLSPDLVADLLPQRSKVTVSVGPMAALDIAGLVTQLDRYPYGCAEQTTSKALPLVYLNEMAKLAGMKPDESIKPRVQGAIERLMEMQDGSGAFGIWGPGDGDMWLTAYVTDFLTRAKEAGFTVPGRPFAQALDRLANSVSGHADFEKGGEDLAYTLYVLARNGRAPIGELRYYADTRIARFATPLARTQIGAALAMLGDRERAEKAFKTALAGFEAKDDGRFRADYGSTLRDGAAMLTLAAESRISGAEAPKLASVIGKAFTARTYTSTQENAWMLLAARAMLDEAKQAKVSVNGSSRQGAFSSVYSVDELKAGSVTIVNEAEQETTALVTATGDAATPEPAINRGFVIERRYFTLDGKPAELASATGGNASLTQNQRLVVLLKVMPSEAREGRLLVVDRLPAGLEIENPRLLDSGATKSLPWLETGRAPQHTEFRDDRFVAAVDLSQRGDEEGKARDKLAFAYIVRAVSPGTYLHPAATVEDMYRPERFARTAAGRLEVKAKE